MSKKFLIIIFSVFMGSIMAASFVHAEVCPPGGGGVCSQSTTVKLDNPFKAVCNSGDCGVYELLKAIVDNILLPIGGVLAVLGFIASGFMYVMAQGKPAGITKATHALTYTAIGTAILLGAYAIAKVIGGTLAQFGGPASTLK